MIETIEIGLGFFGLLVLPLAWVWTRMRRAGTRSERARFAISKGFVFTAKQTWRNMPDLGGLATFEDPRQLRRLRNVLHKTEQDAQVWMFSCGYRSARSDTTLDLNVYYARLPGLDLPAFAMCRKNNIDELGQTRMLGAFARRYLGARTPLEMEESKLWSQFNVFGQDTARIRQLFDYQGAREALSHRFWLGTDNESPLVGLEGCGRKFVVYREGRWLRPHEYEGVMLAGGAIRRALAAPTRPSILNVAAGTEGTSKAPRRTPGAFQDLRENWRRAWEVISRVLFALSLIPSLGLTIYLSGAEGADVETAIILAMIAYCWSIILFREWRVPKSIFEFPL